MDPAAAVAVVVAAAAVVAVAFAEVFATDDDGRGDDDARDDGDEAAPLPTRPVVLRGLDNKKSRPLGVVAVGEEVEVAVAVVGVTAVTAADDDDETYTAGAGAGAAAAVLDTILGVGLCEKNIRCPPVGVNADIAAELGVAGSGTDGGAYGGPGRRGMDRGIRPPSVEPARDVVVEEEVVDAVVEAVVVPPTPLFLLRRPLELRSVACCGDSEWDRDWDRE